MKIILTESQYKNLKENFDQVLDLYSKMSDGEELRPSEKDILRAFKRFTERGGNPEDFIFDMDDVYDTDEREGMSFKYRLKGKPFTFEFSEEIDKGNEIEYYGEITFNGDEFLGVIVTDKRGYLLGYDFYSTLNDEDIRLQDVLSQEGSDAEVQLFFQEEVINTLRR
jgi:hypothetical protein